ncbi:MAG TPA: class I SAM-dependent methyltransferase [Thermoleophilaceae bacterium]|nr:class I SAM-dependent methyltransferase [Thermoleophilaceae bacterium]
MSIEGGSVGRPESCRLCGTPELSLRYADVVIADPHGSAGLRSIWECRRCHAYWSDLPSEVASSRYYREKPKEHHAQLEAGTQRFRRVRTALEAGLGREPRRLLDVGCAGGAHFDVYGEGVERFGIEPAASAAPMLAERGVTWLGKSVDDAPEAGFDAVTSLDVLEHVEWPRPFLDGLDRCLAPGGVIAIVTGDIDSFSARWGRRRWLYYALPEHCSFYSERALRRYWVEERGYEQLDKTWIANADVDPAYVRNFLGGIAREAAMKALPARRTREMERAGRGRFPFFCDNLLVTYRKP